MLLGVLLLAVAAVALVAGSGLIGSAASSFAGRRVPAATVRSVVIGLSAALAVSVVAAGQNRTAVAAGVPFGAAMFVLAAAFGAAPLLARRRSEVREPVIYAAPAAGIVFAALSTATDRAFGRFEGLLLAVVFVPYLLWVLMEPTRETPAREADYSAHDSGDDAAAWVVEPAPRVESSTAVVEAPAPPARSGSVSAGLLVGGLALVTGGAFLLLEGTVRVGVASTLLPGFAGAALAGSLAALPFALLVVFPRAGSGDDDLGGSALTVVTGLVTFVPGIAAIVRPYEFDGPAAIAVLSVAALYALSATWMLLRGRSDRIMGALVLLAYAGCLLLAGSL
jgi:Ca2+/Na+ antiporter